MTTTPLTPERLKEIKERAEAARRDHESRYPLPTDAFNLVAQDVPDLVDEVERLKRRVGQLGEALAFAASCIKSGEPWTTTCEREIGDVLANRPDAALEAK